MVTRDDGSKQWAFQGKPLYTYAEDKMPMDGSGNGKDGVWHIALFKAGEGYKVPDGVAVVDSANASAQILANEQGMPLYTFDADPMNGKPTCVSQPCTDHWTPYVAAQLAKPIPDFTVVDRGDGVFQWAFKGKPLYAYDGDVEPGDANGNGLGNTWHVAAVFRNFTPSGIIIERNRFGASTLATAANGMPALCPRPRRRHQYRSQSAYRLARQPDGRQDFGHQILRRGMRQDLDPTGRAG